MQSDHVTIRASDATELYTHRWLPERDCAGAALVIHGMGEHGGRYAPFAEALVAAGMAVYAPDLRGHGRTAERADRIIHFADRQGWELAIGDTGDAVSHIRAAHPAAPLFLVGHSMGSLLVRSYVQKHGDSVRGAVLSATQDDPGMMAKIGLQLARFEIRRVGLRNPSKLLRNLLFGKFNRAFRPNRTPFDWLNGDEREVDRYIADPLVARGYSAAFFRDLIQGVIELNRRENMARTPRALPLLFVSGELDPLGGFASGVKKTANRYRTAGCTDVTVNIYEGARHEIFHESCKLQAYRDIVDWMAACGKARSPR